MAMSSGVAMVGAVAQLGEHLLCKQGVSGSIPLSSTILCPDAVASFGCCAPDGPPNDRRRPLALRSFASFEVKVMLSSEEIKVCTTRSAFSACSAKIVKRRLIWRLPGSDLGPSLKLILMMSLMV